MPLPGWTLPSVMTAGAAQTFSNVHGTLVGRNILMVGSGNVGLIVSYQLMQAGAEIRALVEAAPRITGYLVHAGKIQRAGVPVYTSHTVVEARGAERVPEAVVAHVDEKFRPIPGTEQTIPVDTILLAVGLNPRMELASMFRCRTTYEGALGGILPVHDSWMRSSDPHVYVCGDLAGVEEANTALEKGVWPASTPPSPWAVPRPTPRRGWRNSRRACAPSAAEPTPPAAWPVRNALWRREEPVMSNQPSRGFALLECCQEIPCNPCATVCKTGAIVKSTLNSRPEFKAEKCVGCKLCVAACPGQAIFFQVPDLGDGKASITFPYEYRPLPRSGPEGDGGGPAGQRGLSRPGSVGGAAPRLQPHRAGHPGHPRRVSGSSPLSPAAEKGGTLNESLRYHHLPL